MTTVETAPNSTTHTAPAPAHAPARTVPAPGTARPQHHRAPRTDRYLEDSGSDAWLAITPDTTGVTPDATGATGAAYLWEKPKKDPT
ncbi:hypothetical protein [Streptomyces sp. NPDC056983]|uniref:hypothetical protein n=1 Tax=Streptomyces sp. NPDC056983 TaxID=3345987 RepID=UPI00362EF401